MDFKTTINGPGIPQNTEVSIIENNNPVVKEYHISKESYQKRVDRIKSNIKSIEKRAEKRQDMFAKLAEDVKKREKYREALKYQRRGFWGITTSV